MIMECFKKGMESMIDAITVLLLFAMVYTREWFPQDILILELQLAGRTYVLDILGAIVLVAFAVAWQMYKRVVAEKIVLFIMGVCYRISRKIKNTYRHIRG